MQGHKCCRARGRKVGRIYKSMGALGRREDRALHIRISRSRTDKEHMVNIGTQKLALLPGDPVIANERLKRFGDLRCHDLDLRTDVEKRLDFAGCDLATSDHKHGPSRKDEVDREAIQRSSGDASLRGLSHGFHGETVPMRVRRRQYWASGSSGRPQYARFVVLLSFLATAISAWLFQTFAVAAFTKKRPQDVTWTVALAMFTAACVCLSIGTSTAWDQPTFRIFYLTGAVLNVPWLALGTVTVVATPATARRCRAVLLFFSGLAAGVVLTANFAHHLPASGIPSGKELFGVFPRVLAAVGSGLGATVIIVGAVLSAWALRNDRSAIAKRRMTSNGMIALGTLILAAGGTLQGFLGKDMAFVACTATGIGVIAIGTRLVSASSSTTSRNEARVEALSP